jgi:WD40 repeat protein
VALSPLKTDWRLKLFALFRRHLLTCGQDGQVHIFLTSTLEQQTNSSSEIVKKTDVFRGAGLNCIAFANVRSSQRRRARGNLTLGFSSLAGQSRVWWRRSQRRHVRFLVGCENCRAGQPLLQPDLGCRLQLDWQPAGHVCRVRTCVLCFRSGVWTLTRCCRETKIKMVNLFDVKSVSQFNEHKAAVKSMAFDPSGDYVASADCTGAAACTLAPLLSSFGSCSLNAPRRVPRVECRRQAQRVLEHALPQD